MKHIPLLPLVLTISLACLRPFAALAQDDSQKNGDKKESKGHHQKSDKSATQPVKVSQGGPGPASHGEKVRNPGSGASFQRDNVQAVNPQTITQQNVQRGDHHDHSQYIQSQVQFTQPQGNRNNRYGGRWVGADEHTDWDNGGEHYWHHHHYRWYDGGWLIIDTGYTPVYHTGGSIASAVQQRLAEQGYYHGPIDGDIGPGSSRAIANYQDDNGLRATGSINDALVGSLGLQ